MVHADISVIAAPATPPGEGAIAVVRVSGGAALEVADRVFRGPVPLSGAGGYTVHHGHVVDRAGAPVDEALALVFRAPHSYTGDDSVEFHCHGGILVTQEVLKVLFDAGAQPAGPGEFTRRAFLNGRIDLTQAEAVADLIAARSVRGRIQSLQQLEGKLGHKIGELRGLLVDLCALLELDLDFSQEGISLAGKEDVLRRIEEIHAAVSSMAETYEGGRIARDGVLVVLAGRPNAGKSSLFNALLGEARTIVTEVPGTTRDTIEESLVIDGILFRLVDTAGLRRPADAIEAEGVDRTRHQVKYADIILLVEDVLQTSCEEEIDRTLKELRDSQHLIVAFNKIDLLGNGNSSAPNTEAKVAKTVRISARTGEGLDKLKTSLVEAVRSTGVDASEGVVVTSKRHLDAMKISLKSLERAMEGIAENRGNEFIAQDIRESAVKLSEITGEVTTEEILNSIFSRFCIGK